MKPQRAHDPTRVLVLLLALAAGLGPCLARTANAATRPNVIVLLADDLGYHDLGVQGATDIRTPNLDALARNGIRFTSGYVSAPLCSPSRAGLLTGRYQQRFGHEMNPGQPLEHDPLFGLPVTETTLAGRLKSLGYATAMIGKSHLGGTEPFHPLRRGFDEFFGFLEGQHKYLNPGLPLNQPDPILRGYTPVPETNYLTAAFAREITNYISRHTQEPFFIYAPFNGVHEPLQAPAELLGQFDPADFPDTNRLVMAAMLLGLDRAVGAIMTELRRHHLDTNTLILFTSDNGGPTPLTGSLNTPLRDYKGKVYEGGIRVPYIISWPGGLPTNRVVDTPVSSLDFLPTAVAAADGAIPAAWQLDGVNLLPFLRGETATPPHPTLFWRMETEGQRAIRQDEWKLVKLGITQNWELFHLASDIGETNNLAARHPEIVQRLVSAYEAWNAQLARPRWDYENPNYVAPAFLLDDLRIGATPVSYQSPRFQPDGNQAAFVDSDRSLWTGTLEPFSGRFATIDGRERRIDTLIASPTGPADGPSWGESTPGPALYYTKPATNGRLAVWRAPVSPADAPPARVSPAGLADFLAVRASTEPADPVARLVMGTGSPGSPATVWALEGAPGIGATLPRHAGGSGNGQWIPGTADIAYAGFPPGPVVTAQIARYRTATGTAELVSADPGDKSDAWGFHAPELNGELCFAAIVDHAVVAIYGPQPGSTNGVPARLATLSLPANAPHGYLHSLVPVDARRGFNGMSWFLCLASAGNDPENPDDTSLWLLGWGPDPLHRVARRIDAGAAPGAPAADRRDPAAWIGAREVFAYYTRRDGTNPVALHVASTGLRRPDHQGTPSGFADLRFTASLQAGTTNELGEFLGGTEVTALAGHGGRLYAAVGDRDNRPYPPLDIPEQQWVGARILVKESPDGPWRMDGDFANHLRVEALTEVHLTTDGSGQAFRDPLPLLLASLQDITVVGARQVSARMRHDPSGRWIESHVATADGPSFPLAFGDHVHRTSRVHQVFAGTSGGAIHSGVFDSGRNNLLWNTNAEFQGAGPVTGFAEANGFLYATAGVGPADSNQPPVGGLYVRVDASNTWRRVSSWSPPPDPRSASVESRLMRGLTTVRDPRGASNTVLIGARSWPGVIERIDPLQDHAVTVELDVRDFFARLWNDDRVRTNPVSVAGTGFTPVTDPVTGEELHLVGVQLDTPDALSPSYKGSHYLIRHRDATYEAADIGNILAPPAADQSLRATRTIAGSPFPGEAGTGYYFGGYDTRDQISRQTAWIQRGTWTAWPRLVVSQPDPPAWQLTWSVAWTNWVLEASGAVGPSAAWNRVPGLSTRSLTNETRSLPSPGSNVFFRLRRP